MTIATYRLIMALRSSRYGLLLVASVTAAIVAAACGSSSEATFADGKGGDASADPNGQGTSTTGTFGDTVNGGDGSVNTQGLDVQPNTLQVIQAVLGQPAPTVTFTATV